MGFPSATVPCSGWASVRCQCKTLSLVEAMPSSKDFMTSSCRDDCGADSTSWGKRMIKHLKHWGFCGCFHVCAYIYKDTQLHTIYIYSMKINIYSVYMYTYICVCICICKCICKCICICMYIYICSLMRLSMLKLMFFLRRYLLHFQSNNSMLCKSHTDYV